MMINRIRFHRESTVLYNEVDKNIEKKLLSLVMKNSFVNIVKIDILHRFLSFIS